MYLIDIDRYFTPLYRINTMDDLLLYSANYCPYCHKVESFLADHDISVKTVYFDEDASLRDELASLGGKAQVPCLIIKGEPLYESEDIIQWFKENY